MSSPKLPEAPGAWESRAFFAALLAACQGKDTEAADILRSIAESMSSEFLPKGGQVGSRRKT